MALLWQVEELKSMVRFGSWVDGSSTKFKTFAAIPRPLQLFTREVVRLIQA